jgi:hypothetical protein
MSERVGRAELGIYLCATLGKTPLFCPLVSIDLCHGSPITNEVGYHAVGFLPLDYVQ